MQPPKQVSDTTHSVIRSAVCKPPLLGGIAAFGGTQNEEANCLLVRLNKLALSLGCFRSGSGSIELHHSDLAICTDLDIGDLEDWSAFDCARSGARQLH